MLKKIVARAMYIGLVTGYKYPAFRPIYQKSNDMLVSRMYKTYLKHGEAGWDKFWVPTMKEFGRIRAPYIAKEMGIDANVPSSIGLFHDFEDPVFGVEGHWEKTEEGLDVRVETACKVCDHLDKITQGKSCPAFCHKIMVAMENGTGQALNDKYYIKVHSLLTEGSDACRVSHHFRE